ncbi:copia-type polyprotein, partial [Trifolium medium]|nr:copia-type polyprotein [Trifolium medium]
ISNGEDLSDDGDESDRLPARVRKPPGYLRDYVTGSEKQQNEIDQNEMDQVQNLAIAMFNSNEDPLTYEEAALTDTWKEAMDAEICAIEANDT